MPVRLIPENAAELLRGLRHSNRLTNETAKRRLILDEFRPSLDNLTSALTLTITPQPLPMVAPFRQAATLLDELLREEACAWKILLAHSATPELADAGNALVALARQATAAVQQYRQVPATCLRDANQIYALAEAEGLFTPQGLGDARHTQIDRALDAYATVLILATLDLRQIRARQLVLALQFLAEHRGKVRLTRTPPDKTWRESDRVVNLETCHTPVTASSYMGDFADASLRWINFAALSQAIDERLLRTRTTLSVTLGSDTLERQTLTRLNYALHTTTRSRKSARCICHDMAELSFGHQLIANQLLQQVNSASAEAEPGREDLLWVRVNYSAQGASFRCKKPQNGTAQVGELVAVKGDSTLIGVIRWVHAADDSELSIGLEYLSNGVVPVQLSRPNVDEGVTDEALIIACRINGKVTQTILLPGYRFHTGDRITAQQADRSKQLKLAQCLQSNGLFSQFVLAEG